MCSLNELCNLTGLQISSYPRCHTCEIPMENTPGCRGPRCGCFCPCRPPVARPFVEPRVFLPPPNCRPSCVTTTPPPAIRCTCCRIVPQCGMRPCCPRMQYVHQVIMNMATITVSSFQEASYCLQPVAMMDVSGDFFQLDGSTSYICEVDDVERSGDNTNNSSKKPFGKTIGPKKNPKYEQWHKQLSEGSMELPNMGLEEIPKSIFEYGQPLKIMHLQDNHLQHLPANFFDDLPNLAWCDLRFNGIRALPEFTKSHNCLRVLMLQDNQLQTLPYSMGICTPKLKTLGLRGNPLHDPPPEIVEAGVDAIQQYFARTLKKEKSGDMASPRYSKKYHRSGRKRGGYSSNCSPQISGREVPAPDFTQALYNSIMKARKSRSCKSTNSKSHNVFANMNSKMAAKIKYTNDVWRDVPFDGTDQKEIINRSLEDMRNHIMKKFSIQRDKLLQRIKDREVLLKWRFETRCLQKAGRRPGSCCLINPPFGISSDVVQDDGPLHADLIKYINLSPEEFQNEVSSCTQTLQNFIENPVSLTDSSAALQRLHEVEEIQRKLCSLKLGGKNPTPF